jgi:hypothetical protein
MARKWVSNLCKFGIFRPEDGHSNATGGDFERVYPLIRKHSKDSWMQNGPLISAMVAQH